MKSLKESILSSTNTGKVAINRKKIEDWCNEHLKRYKITPDFKVINESDTRISLLLVDEVPEYIQFGNITSEFVIGDVINKMTQEQFPDCVKTIQICDCAKIEKPFIFNITNYFSTGSLGGETLKDGFKKLTIAAKKDNPIISFTDSKLNLKNLQKIQFIGEFDTLNLCATPAGSSLMRHIKHRAKMLNQTKLNDSEVTDLLKSIIIPNVADHFKIILTDEFSFKRSKNRYHEWCIL